MCRSLRVLFRMMQSHSQVHGLKSIERMTHISDVLV